MFNFKLLQKSHTWKYGLPMVLLVVGSSFGLREFTQIRYDVQKIKRRLPPSLEAKLNLENQATLEEEYETMKQMNLDDWKNIRGPRPWEDSREYQEQQRRNLSNKDGGSG